MKEVVPSLAMGVLMRTARNPDAWLLLVIMVLVSWAGWQMLARNPPPDE